jgi:two-component system response regulator AtoC
MSGTSDREKTSVLLTGPAEHPELASLLSAEGALVTQAGSVGEAAEILKVMLFDAVLVGVDGAGDDSVDQPVTVLCQRWPDVPVIAWGRDDATVERQALAGGAVSYVAMPTSAAALSRALDAARSRSRSAVALPARPIAGAKLLGESPLLEAVRDKIARLAAGRATVLVRGETGTGKEVVARAIHADSSRSAGPFLAVHAASVPDTLLESELFGYERGAFTGAVSRKKGRVELAEGGTLFFDEIGDVSPSMQVKLLRLIQEREYERLGGTQTLRADVRILAATHRDLEDMTARGTFREDLFYRLNVVTLWLPPLRARREDIAAIVRHYLEVFRRENGKADLSLDESALRLLQSQRWPGNVRQLVNFIERLVVLAQRSLITADDVRRDLEEQLEFLTQASGLDARHSDGILPVVSELPPRLPELGGAPLGNLPAPGVHLVSSAVRPLRDELRRAEHRALTKALHSARGNRALAARMLGISRRTLYTKLDEHEIR